MFFEWDETKRKANLAKHLIDFADAVKVFEGPVFEKRSAVMARIACSLWACYKTLRSS